MSKITCDGWLTTKPNAADFVASQRSFVQFTSLSGCIWTCSEYKMLITLGRRVVFIALVYLFSCALSVQYDGTSLYVAQEPMVNKRFVIDRGAEEPAQLERRKRDASTSPPAALEKNISTWVTVHFLIIFNHATPLC